MKQMACGSLKQQKKKKQKILTVSGIEPSISWTKRPLSSHSAMNIGFTLALKWRKADLEYF